jgi:ribonuclease HI
MELTAASSRLKALPEPLRCRVGDGLAVSEARHHAILNAMEDNGWRTSDRRPVQNQDLWRELDELVSHHTIVAVIEFLEWTEGDRLRHSKFVVFRDDKNPHEVVKEA